MINIAIDGNHHFHKTFGVFAGYGADPGKALRNKGEQAAFIRKVSTDLCALLKMLPIGGRIVFTCDSRSWRKDVEIENGGYKSGRVRDENTDWTIFFELLSSFGVHLEKMGFIFSKVDGAEGDDLLMYWCDYFNRNGENCIIMSGDGDMNQLVDTVGDNWTAVWNTNSKSNSLSVPPGWGGNWLNKNETVSVFNMQSAISPDKDRFKEFLKRVKMIEMDRFPFIFNKILIGDDGDSVPSIWEYFENSKSGSPKLIRFTQSKANKVSEAFISSDFYDVDILNLGLNDEFLDWISGLILRTTKDVDSNDNRKRVAENWRRNTKLMFLNSNVIPEFVNEGAKKEIARGVLLPKKIITLDRIKILEGTEWVGGGYQPKGFDPFELLND
jgi:5'-3' exonuclease